MRALLALADAGVEFVLVGGLAAVAQGVPHTTQDTDVVPRLTDDNLDRLFTALQGMNARLRRSGPVIRPARHHLGPGHLLLDTDLGWLDVLGTLVGGRRWDTLRDDVVELEVEGRRIEVLGLRTILTIKRELATPRDLAQAVLIEATLRRLSD